MENTTIIFNSIASTEIKCLEETEAKDMCFIVSLIQMRWMEEWASVFLRPQVNKYSHKGIRMVTLPGYVSRRSMKPLRMLRMDMKG